MGVIKINGVTYGGGDNSVMLTQAEYDALVEAGTVDPTVLYMITDRNLGCTPYAAGIIYDNTDTGLTATNVQDAIDEVVEDVIPEAGNSLVKAPVVADVYTPTYRQYAVDDYCWYNNALYKCITATTGETFDTDCWEACTPLEDLMYTYPTIHALSYAYILGIYVGLDNNLYFYNPTNSDQTFTTIDNPPADVISIDASDFTPYRYVVGDYVMYNGQLYVCTTNTYGAFDPTAWSAVSNIGSTVFSKMDANNPVGTGSFSMNRRSGTIGTYSFAEGLNCNASGEYSHAEGEYSNATYIAAHAEGEYTTSSGQGSHSEGTWTTASGGGAHSEGDETIASGSCSHAEGVSTTANHHAQHVFGAYNVPDPSSAEAYERGNYVEIVGNGTSSSNKSNARTLDWSGNETLSGNIDAAGFGTTLLNLIYPVGSIYMSVNNTNPGTYLTGTTWVAWGSGRVPVGVSSDSEFNTVEKTGGEKAHTLTTTEMPSHNHDHKEWIFNGATATGAHYGFGYQSNTGTLYTRSAAGSAANEVPFGNVATGGGGAHNNLQPYITCYMWKRTA